MAGNPIESRRAVRKNITLKGNFKIKDDTEYKLHIYNEPIELTLTDIALLGCGFVTKYYLPKGLILSMKVRDFPVIESGNIKETKDIDFTGQVMSCRTTPSRVNRVGLEFINIRREYLDLIKVFVES